jgi:hypothetical protein
MEILSANFSESNRADSARMVCFSCGVFYTNFGSRYVPQRAFHQAPAPSESLPLLLENCHLGGYTTIHLRARCKRQLNPRRPEHSRGLWRWTVGNTQCPSSTRRLLLGLRDTRRFRDTAVAISCWTEWISASFRLYCSPQSCLSSRASTSSALTESSSPR